jgi:hypothetical protein
MNELTTYSHGGHAFPPACFISETTGQILMKSYIVVLHTQKKSLLNLVLV